MSQIFEYNHNPRESACVWHRFDIATSRISWFRRWQQRCRRGVHRLCSCCDRDYWRSPTWARFFFIFIFLLSPIFWLTLARRNFNDVAIFGYRRMSKPNEGSFFRKLVKCYCQIINLLYMGRGIRLEWGIFLCKFCCWKKFFRLVSYEKTEMKWWVWIWITFIWREKKDVCSYNFNSNSAVKLNQDHKIDLKPVPKNNSPHCIISSRDSASTKIASTYKRARTQNWFQGPQLPASDSQPFLRRNHWLRQTKTILTAEPFLSFRELEQKAEVVCFIGKDIKWIEK